MKGRLQGSGSIRADAALSVTNFDNRDALDRISEFGEGDAVWIASPDHLWSTVIARTRGSVSGRMVAGKR